MGNIIASNKEKDYHKFLLKMLELFDEYDIRGIAVVALTDSDNLAGYWNMDLYDRMKVKNEIELDCIDKFIQANKERYLEDEE